MTEHLRVLPHLRIDVCSIEGRPARLQVPHDPVGANLSCAVTGLSCSVIPVEPSRRESVASAAEWSVTMCYANCLTRPRVASLCARRAANTVPLYSAIRGRPDAPAWGGRGAERCDRGTLA